ncbi:hypothetical protein [Buttiauxella gaviniae]|uniref:hypothetical protein n=1 Tax=Buttiauxella gaviniae TaxID=82990 RepID=UPI003C758A53
MKTTEMNPQTNISQKLSSAGTRVLSFQSIKQFYTANDRYILGFIMFMVICVSAYFIRFPENKAATKCMSLLLPLCFLIVLGRSIPPLFTKDKSQAFWVLLSGSAMTLALLSAFGNFADRIISRPADGVGAVIVLAVVFWINWVCSNTLKELKKNNVNSD